MPSLEPRSGSVEAKSFFLDSLNGEEGSGKLEVALDLYAAVLKELVEKADGHGQFSTAATIDRDEKLRENLPNESSMTYQQVEDAFFVKQMKGVSRPNLKLIQKNKDKEVIEITERVFADLRGSIDESGADKTIEKAIEDLSKLPRVGPATASQHLSYAAPDKIAFASDQVLDVMNPHAPRDYKLVEIIDANRALRKACRTLNKGGPGVEWTPEKLGMALFVLGKIHSDKPKDCRGLRKMFMMDLAKLESAGAKRKASQEAEEPSTKVAKA